MTMFSRGTWTIFKIQQADVAPIDTFTQAFEALGTQYIPLCAISRAMHEQTTTLGISPYSSPRLGDEEDIVFKNSEGKDLVENLECSLTNESDLYEWQYDPLAKTLTGTNLTVELVPNFWEPVMASWQIAPGVYGAWMMVFDYTDTQDSNSKKEKMAYDYGAPFKLQSGDIKKQISDSVIDVNALSRKHYQLIVDFNQNLVWLNSAGKPVVELAMGLLSDLGLDVTTPDIIGDLDSDQISEVLNTLYSNSEIQGEQVQRLNSMKLHGPDGVEPNENVTLEKILKAFYSFTEHDGYHLGLSTPATVLLNPNMPTATGAKSIFEATELLLTSDESAITESGLMFTEYIERTNKAGEARRMLSKRFSIVATPNLYHKELPGLIIKGLNVENFKFIVKQHVKATDAAPTIQDYWAMYYDAMKTSVYVYFNTLRDLVEK